MPISRKRNLPVQSLSSDWSSHWGTPSHLRRESMQIFSALHRKKSVVGQYGSEIASKNRNEDKVQ